MRMRTWKESPEKGGRGSRKENNLVREFKRSPGSTRAAAAGVCVAKLVGGGREKNLQRREEEILEWRKF